MQAFQQAMNYAKKETKDDEKMVEDDSVSGNPIERLFQLELETKTHNKEVEHEEPKIAMERAMKLRCYIDNNNDPIDTIEEGLDIGLKGELEKYSEAAGRNCVYEKAQKINQLPSYLCVNFVRFYWTSFGCNANFVDDCIPHLRGGAWRCAGQMPRGWTGWTKNCGWDQKRGSCRTAAPVDRMTQHSPCCSPWRQRRQMIRNVS